jgi:hypothetical protein
VDKVAVQPYLLLVEASKSFEKAELAAKEAPTDALERAATAPSRKTAIPIGARENPDGSESNQDEGATKQYRVTSSVLDEPWCVHHGAMVSWFVWLFMYIFITSDIIFGFLARKPNLISSEFWGLTHKLKKS